MTSRPWYIVRWFGFLGIGLTISIGSGMHFRTKRPATESLLARRESRDDSLIAQAPRDWLAPEPDRVEPEPWSDPPALPERAGPTEVVLAEPPDAMLDPNSPQAEQEIDAVVAALAGLDVQNVQVRAIDDRGSRRFVFSCDVPTGAGAESFVGEGPDPPSAARHALSRIRSWAAAPSETTFR
ncbi:MAG TPA: hypothetical protein VGN57_15110 [Pirellulaceae bacterium]|jgi:hypothetical protein|nr:hypothetical protein [Pirellulaceae bacterium]